MARSEKGLGDNLLPNTDADKPTRRQPFVMIPAALIRDDRLGAYEIAAYSALKLHQNSKTNDCFPGHERLMYPHRGGKQRMSKPTLVSCLRKLESAGWIQREERKRKGYMFAYSYTLYDQTSITMGVDSSARESVAGDSSREETVFTRDESIELPGAGKPQLLEEETVFTGDGLTTLPLTRGRSNQTKSTRGKGSRRETATAALSLNDVLDLSVDQINDGSLRKFIQSLAKSRTGRALWPQYVDSVVEALRTGHYTLRILGDAIETEWEEHQSSRPGKSNLFSVDFVAGVGGSLQRARDKAERLAEYERVERITEDAIEVLRGQTCGLFGAELKRETTEGMQALLAYYSSEEISNLMECFKQSYDFSRPDTDERFEPEFLAFAQEGASNRLTDQRMTRSSQILAKKQAAVEQLRIEQAQRAGTTAA